MSDTRKRLVSAVARLEQLRQRNDAQRRSILAAASQMADHATGAADELRPQILAGDVDAARLGRRALYGRALARRLLEDEQDV